MNYIGDPQTTTAKYWRIRHGARDGMIALPLIPATTLENKGSLSISHWHVGRAIAATMILMNFSRGLTQSA